ncbi:WhiB family transcriptional regulator [Streptomyces sp. B21-106]|uniref:WhiB family transcriptional regulator n=1 Tax=Streptomyces sp. B21-106 TaxID=3039418 RepID=UPI002FEF3A22
MRRRGIPRSSSPSRTSRPPARRASLARAVCRRCAVLVACRDWALEHGEDDGIWGCHHCCSAFVPSEERPWSRPRRPDATGSGAG